MNQNKKLIENMEAYDLRELLKKESPVERFERIMYEVAGDEKRDIVKEIIKTLKPKQNGKRN
jgi:broad-specificity NMP kinase